MALKLNLDKTVTALASGISGVTGLLVRTASGFITRTLTGPAAGISVSNGSGVSGNPTLTLANDLAAVEGLSSTGIAVRSGTDTWVQRSLGGTGLAVASNADGVSGNPSIAVTAATKSDQTTGTSTTAAVVPNIQQQHASAAKCWAFVAVAAGTPALSASYNMTSVTDSGVGDLTLTIATDFATVNWCSVISVERTGAAAVEAHIYVVAKAVGSIEIEHSNATPALVDPDAYNFVGFGAQ